MFRRPGLRVDGKVFGFLGSDDRLMVKLPRDSARAAVEEGRAEPVTMGTRTMKEWVALPLEDGGDTARRAWSEALERALAHVAAQPPPTRH